MAHLANKSVTTRVTAAYWYAVGMSDGTGQPDRAQEFSEYVEREAKAYHIHHTSTFLASIPDQWRAFSTLAAAA